MNVGKLYELKKIQDQYGVLMSFTGPFSQGIIEEFGDATKAYVDFEDGSKSSNYNVFSIYIEQTQNIKKYIETKKNNPEVYNNINKSGIVTVCKRDNHFSISSGNLIEHSDIDNLKNQLEYLKTLDKNNLKELYKKERRKRLTEDSVSAGLGLIDMARKSSGNLEYSFQKRDENFSFFCLEVLI